MTRERLLDAAIQCLADTGYAATTTSAVCARSGLSRGAQLHHFPSKQELLVGAVQQLFRARMVQLRADTSSLGDAPDPVRAAVQRVWSTFTGPLFYAAAELWLAARTDPVLYATLLPVEREIGRQIHAEFQHIFPPEIAGSPRFDAALDSVLYLMRGLAMTRILREDVAEQDRVLTICVDLLTAGVAPPLR